MSEDLQALLTATPESLRRFAELHQKAAIILRAWAAAAVAKDPDVIAACVDSLQQLAAVQTQGVRSVPAPTA